MKLPETIKEQLLAETRFSASRSGGPGGQNVNKVNSAVELRFSVVDSRVFNSEQKERILHRLKNRINIAGELVIFARAERTQGRNREDVIRRFFQLLERALTISKKRKRTYPTAASRINRLKSKKVQGEKKVLRRPPQS